MYSHQESIHGTPLFTVLFNLEELAKIGPIFRTILAMFIYLYLFIKFLQVSTSHITLKVLVFHAELEKFNDGLPEKYSDCLQSA